MKSIDSIKITEKTTIKEALQIIDRGSMRIALVVDENDKLLGTLTDGDIRRGLLKALDLNSTVETIYNPNPTYATVSSSKEEILNLAILKKLHQIPIVDYNHQVVGIVEIEDLVRPKEKPNIAVIMAGGLGTRLRPLTDKLPKPMLKIGDKPILQTIIEKFSEHGFKNFIICVNYKGDTIQNFFGNGENLGINIEYVREEKRLGTAGALSLVKDKLKEPFFVMNGDLLTNINFEHLYNYHISNQADATMCVREYDFQVPYGVVNLKDNLIQFIEEKPVQRFFVSAGIYMLFPETLKYIPTNEYFDMPELFKILIEENKRVVAFPLREYWIDIGRFEEYEKANMEYKGIFDVQK